MLLIFLLNFIDIKVGFWEVLKGGLEELELLSEINSNRSKVLVELSHERIVYFIFEVRVLQQY